MAFSTREISTLMFLLTNTTVSFILSALLITSLVPSWPEHVSELRFHDKFKPFSRQRYN